MTCIIFHASYHCQEVLIGPDQTALHGHQPLPSAAVMATRKPATHRQGRPPSIKIEPDSTSTFVAPSVTALRSPTCQMPAPSSTAPSSGRPCGASPGSASSCRSSHGRSYLAATILASAMAFIDEQCSSRSPCPHFRPTWEPTSTSLQWVTNSYALLLGRLILIGGAAGDGFGRQRVPLDRSHDFRSLVAALARWLRPSGVLIGARSFPGSWRCVASFRRAWPVLSAASFPKEIRGRAIGIWAGASAIAGPRWVLPSGRHPDRRVGLAMWAGLDSVVQSASSPCG